MPNESLMKKIIIEWMDSEFISHVPYSKLPRHKLHHPYWTWSNILIVNMLINNNYLKVHLGPLWFEGLEEKEGTRERSMKKRKETRIEEEKEMKGNVWYFPELPKETNWLRWILPTCQASSRNLLIKG